MSTRRPIAPLVTLKIPAGLAAGDRLPVKREARLSRLHRRDLRARKGRARDDADDRRRRGRRPSAARASTAGARAAQAARRAGDVSGRRQAHSGSRVPYPAAAAVAGEGYFFPLTDGAIDYAAPQKVARDGDRLVIETPRPSDRPDRSTACCAFGSRASCSTLRPAPSRRQRLGRDGGQLAVDRADRLRRRGARRADPQHHALRLPDPQPQGAEPRQGGRRRGRSRAARRWPIPPAWCWCASRSAARCWRCARAAARSAGRSSCRIRA